MSSKSKYTPSSRIEKDANMTLSDLLGCFSEMRRRDEIALEMEKEKDQAALECNSDFFSHLSLEIICHILEYLPLRDVLRMELQCKKIQKAVSMNLRIRKSIDFTEGEIHSWIPTVLNDAMLSKLISRCDELESVYGFHSKHILKRRQRGSEMLTIPGIIAALTLAPKLKGIEVSDITLMEAILAYIPRLEILGTFRNRNGVFPINPSNKLVLTSNPKITSLHLTGVVLSELPKMSHMKHLYLRWVKITHSHPFRDFSVPCLKSFVMSNCAGPSSTLKYVPLITGLAAARSLTRLELVRVPFLGGLFQHIVEDSWRVHGFSQLQSVTFGACKHAQEVDLGFLMITAASSLEGLSIQPLLTKDSLFAAIKMADVSFPVFESLHLGYVDPFPEPGRWNQEDLAMIHGLAEVSENPAMITDIGMKAIGQCFSFLRNLQIYNCPHLHFPTSWTTPGADTWSHLRHLHLRRCHAVRLQDFCRFIESLPQLELLHLEYMFREPPKGCARVGLSAGTGLGVSSALVQNNGNDGVNIDGGHNNDEDEDLHLDDINNNHDNLHEAANLGGDVNNNDPGNENVENAHAELDDDSLDEDDDEFEEFSDNPDDLDFDGLSGDEENIDLANHIGDDIQIAEVAANQASGDNSQDEDMSGDGRLAKLKPVHSGNMNECKPGPSREVEPQPSTSGYSACSRKKDVGMAPIPTVDSRSTCQLVDIDIGEDSDVDMGTPPDGKIKVKVECNSAIELRPTDEGAETKFVSSNGGSCRLIDDSVPSTSSLSLCAQKRTHKSQTEPVPSCSHSVTENSDYDLSLWEGELDNSCSNVPKERKSDSKDEDLRTRNNTDSSRGKSQNSGEANCDESKMSNKNNQNLPRSSSFNSPRCESSGPSASSGDISDRTQTGSRASAGDCYHKAKSDKAKDETVVQPSSSRVRNDENSCSAGSSGKDRKDMTADELLNDIAREFDIDLDNPQSPRDNRYLFSREEMKEMGFETESESDDEQKERRCYNMRPRKNKSGSRGNASTKPRDKEDVMDEVKKDSEVDGSQPGPVSDSQYLFMEEEMMEMGFGKDQDSNEETEDISKSYNMRPRKRGKSLNGKKKGLVKKQRMSVECTNTQMQDKSCQAVSDEIRETTKLAKEQEDKGGAQQRPEGSKTGASNSGSSRRRCTRSYSTLATSKVQSKAEPFSYQPVTRRKKNLADKSTSTSDPVIEDDHIQVLSLRSRSLLCVSLYMVGVTDIIIDDCPNLSLLRGSACRVLKKVTVGGAPKLSKVWFAQCKKIDEMHLVNEVCDQISQTNRVVYLRPMRQFDMFAFENMLFCQPDIDYHLCVIYDYSPDPSSTMYNRARITSWLDLFTGMNMELLRFMDFEQAKNFPVDEAEDDKCYRSAYIMHGYNDDGSEWTLSTDIPWLDHLSQCADVDSPDLHPDDYKEGVYCPRRKGHHLTTDCLMDLQDVVADMRNKGVSLYCYSVIVYVNMCDVSGTPTPDIYL